ncbi:hypothetical protein Tco_0277429 [Tanacetum coccineum]
MEEGIHGEILDKGSYLYRLFLDLLLVQIRDVRLLNIEHLMRKFVYNHFDCLDGHDVSRGKKGNVLYIDGANGYEAQVMDMMGAEGYGDLLQFQSTWPL